MKLTVCGPYVRLLLAADDGDTGREDVLMAAEAARVAAEGLEDLAAMALRSDAPVLPVRPPSVAVECVVSRGKPLVRWRFGWRAVEQYLTPPHALMLARLTRLAAADAEGRAEWPELREPRCLLR